MIDIGDNRGLADANIRPALRTLVMAGSRCNADAAIIEELGLCRGQVRVDLAVVDGTIHGYEIKSDRDSLRRLAAQSALYSRVLDRCTLVLGARHIDEALGVVPDWWAVMCFEAAGTGIRFKTVRRGRRNPGRDTRALVELLWLDEALALLERHNAARGVKGKPRRFVWDRVCGTIKADEIAAAVCESLRFRAMLPAPARLS